jgi:hypothetical protein
MWKVASSTRLSVAQLQQGAAVAVASLRSSSEAGELRCAAALLAAVTFQSALQRADVGTEAISQGALPGLARVMALHAEDNRLQEHACIACCRLCGDPDACKRAVDAALMEAVVAALKAHAAPSTYKLCSYGIDALALLAGSPATAQPLGFHADSTLNAIAAAMRAHLTVAALQERGCDAACTAQAQQLAAAALCLGNAEDEPGPFHV